MTMLVEPVPSAELTRTSGRGGAKQAPYLIPHVRELRPTSAIHYGVCHGRLVDSLRHAGITRVLRYDPANPSPSRRPRGFYDLLISIDLLERIEEAEVDVTLAEMAALAREAIIIIDTKPSKIVLEDGRDAHVTLRPHAWWQERLQSHFSYVEPIRVRSRRRAAFKTWPTRGRSKIWMSFIGEELRYRIAKLGIRAT